VSSPRATPASRLDRAAAALVVLGALAVVLTSLPYKTFELDRFFIPKELVLHVTALLATVLVLERASRAALGPVDLFLAGWLALSALSAAFAENWWLAARGLAISASGAALFWTARAVGRAGLWRALSIGLVVATVVGAGTALAQAYGVVSDFASLARAPGGTFGNRNFMAHLAAIGLPALACLALGARRGAGAALGALALCFVTVAVVLSRSRAAWLAILATAGLVAAGALWRRSLLPAAAVRRAVLLVAAAGAGAAIALLVPNRLNWKSDNPYLESVTGMVNYESGSGHGRLVQYRRTFEMAMQYPITGVGPGNWAVVYPRFAADDDPSLNSEGMTANPWPSSDWAAFLAERGLAGAACVALALAGLALAAIRRLREARHADEVIAALALLGTTAATVLVGLFDAVLLLAVPSLVAWALLGALAAGVGGTPRWTPALPTARRQAAIVAVALLGTLFVVRSTSQVVAMATYENGRGARRFDRAATADPGSYRIRMRAAQAAFGRGDRARGCEHARAARSLYPRAPEARRLAGRCGGRRR
jgi:O-antigen ligase